MQSQPQCQARVFEPFKNKIASLTVKQIQLNLENQRGIMNNCNNWNANWAPHANNGRVTNSRHPFKMFQPRRHLAPLIRKELPALFKANQNQNNLGSQDNLPEFATSLKKKTRNNPDSKKKTLPSHAKTNMTEAASSDHHQVRMQSGKSNARNTFLLNSIIEILKTGKTSEQDALRPSLSQNETSNDISVNVDNATPSSSVHKNGISKRIHLKTEPAILEPYNQFSDLKNIGSGAMSTKAKRGPKIIQNEITRLGNHNVIRSRKLYSQEKSRIYARHQSKDRNSEFDNYYEYRATRLFTGNNDFGLKQKSNDDQLQNVEILTFYNTKKRSAPRDQQENDNQFLLNEQIQ